eukprot:IDg18997t1
MATVSPLRTQCTLQRISILVPRQDAYGSRCLAGSCRIRYSQILVVRAHILRCCRRDRIVLSCSLPRMRALEGEKSQKSSRMHRGLVARSAVSNGHAALFHLRSRFRLPSRVLQSLCPHHNQTTLGRLLKPLTEAGP